MATRIRFSGWEIQRKHHVHLDKVPISGAPTNKLSIRYAGQDPSMGTGQLSLEQARSVLAQWGYRK
jgi:hypothetical protein